MHDATSLAALQAEITDALASLDSISTDTVFGSKKLLDGTATGLEFQVGADSGQTVSLDLPAVDSTTLLIDLIDVTTDAAGAITSLDTAIGTIVTARNTMGSFQSNALESKINYLQAASENMTAARSVIMDADFAVEVAQFTKLQILLQSGMQVQKSAPQFPQLVLGLLG